MLRGSRHVDQPTTLRLSLHPEDDTTPDDLERLTAALRDELLMLDVEQVTAAPGGPAPEGAKVIGLAGIGALLITVVSLPACSDRSRRSSEGGSVGDDPSRPASRSATPD